MKKDNFKFYIPADLVKATDEKGQEVMKFNGIASSPNLDSQQEYLDPSGFDLSSFKYVNWNHSKEPGKIIGEPTKYEITKNNELYVEGILYPEVKAATDTWDLMRALKNSPSGNKLGISVEGKILAKDPKNSKRITKARITAIALCSVPINGATWADIVKGEMPDEEVEEELDEETKKAMTAAEAEGVTQKPDVEHCKKDMKKSDVFEQIFLQYPELDVEKSQSVYQLITKIATMSTENKITDETLKKAFDILGLAKAEGEKEEPKAEEKKEENKEEDDDQKEMVEKAKSKKAVMKAAGKTDEEVKKSLENTFSALIVEKALSTESNEQPVGLAKSEIENIVKANTDNINLKLGAVLTVLEKQIAQNIELQKSIDAVKIENEELKGKVDKISTTPLPRKSETITKSFTDKFITTEGGVQKPVYNLKNKAELKSLKEKVVELSGLNKGDGKFDNELVQIAQEMESMGGIYKSESIARLQACGFEMIAE